MSGYYPVAQNGAIVALGRSQEDGVLAIKEAGRERNVPVVINDRLVHKAQAHVIDEIPGHRDLREQAMRVNERSKAEGAGFGKERNIAG